MTWLQGTNVRAKRNTNVTIEAQIISGTSKLCPARSAAVITGVRFGALERCPTGVPESSHVPLTLGGAPRLNAQTCSNVPRQGNTLMYTINVGNPSGRANWNCTKLLVATSDGFETTLLLRLTPESGSVSHAQNV
jgi:hypothetical protein